MWYIKLKGIFILYSIVILFCLIFYALINLQQIKINSMKNSSHQLPNNIKSDLEVPFYKHSWIIRAHNKFNISGGIAYTRGL